MNCRQFFRRTALSVIVVLAALTLTGCFEKDPNSGPVEVVWDHDVCEHCNMVISNRRYAAQLREPDGTAHKYDDFGDAILDLKAQGWDGEKIEFWVTDYKTGLWINAFKARYVPGETTPMGFGLGATTVPGVNDLRYEEAKAAVLAHGK